MSQRDEILKNIKTVPSLPAVVVQLRQYLNDPDVDFEELAKVIEYDPGLTVNVLRLANSSYFGWSGTISSVREAISRLGTARIFQMVLCMMVAPLVSKPIQGYDLDSGDLWQHSIATAVCSEQLALKLKLADSADAFTAGLLHDIGKVILGTFIDVDDEPIKAKMQSDSLAFNEAEKAVLDIDHAEVAGILLQNWSLPDEVVDAARLHHEPDQGGANPQLTDLIHLADVLCMKVGWGMGSDGLHYRFNEASADRLGLDIHQAEDVIMKVMEGLEDLQNMFSPSTEGEPNGVQHSHS